MTKKHIEAALAKLDTENTEHWTSTGLPRIEAVNALMDNTAPGFVPATRQDIQSAAPGFTKETLIEMRKNTVIVAPEAQKTEPDAPSDPAPGTQDAETKAEETEEQDPEPDAAKETEIMETKPDIIPAAPVDPAITDETYVALTQEIEACAELKRRNLARIEECKQENAETDKKATRLLLERERLFPPKTPAQAIQEYLAQQAKVREERKAQSKKLAELTGGGVVQKAPIDQQPRGGAHKRAAYGQTVGKK